MLPALLVLAAALFGSTCSANINKHMRHLQELNNTVDHAAIPSNLQLIRKSFHISLKPGPLIEHIPGTMVEIVCEALGSPAPSIHWFKNDAPIYKHDQQSTEIIYTNPNSVARLKSKLLVVKTDGEDRYTCLGRSGGQLVMASTTVYRKANSTDLTERLKLHPQAPQILVYYSAFVDIVGNNVVLPCHTRGHPKPDIVWTHIGNDHDNETVVTNNPRLKVLRSGELVISPLLWNDMGEFTCYANNTYGTDRRVTFVYPAKEGTTPGYQHIEASSLLKPGCSC